MKLLDRFNKTMQDLSDEGNELVIEIYKLGYPEKSKEIQTASVVWDEHKKRVKFLFNDEFQKTLTDDEFKFVVAHEAIHLLNGHILLLKERLSEMKQRKVSDQEMHKFVRKFNIASDCVVNDSLVNLYGLKPIMTEQSATKPKIFYGKDVIGVNCHDLTAMEVYSMIDDNEIDQMDETSIDQHIWESFFDARGNVKDSFVEKLKNFISKNIENSALSDKELESVSKVNKNFQKLFKAGNEQLGAYRPVDNLTKVALNWNKIFFQLTERRKFENNWSRPNNKLISVYPDVIIPSLKNEEKEDIFIAIDSSGSIDYKALELFVSVVKNIPKHFNVKAISFDTKCYEFDILKDKNPKGGGGTRFDIIQTYIDENFKKQPNLVLVLTDGYGNDISPKVPSKWAWLLYGECYTGHIRGMRNFRISDLLL